MASQSLRLALLIFVTAIISHGLSQKDETFTELAVGKDVTEAVLQKLSDSEIFPYDHSFLIRLAYVESRFGAADTTFQTNYYGGIWKVDETIFRATKNVALRIFHEEIRNKFQIYWADIPWKSCLAPMYSGLAAALYFAQSTITIPDQLDLQGDLWKESYNRAGNNTADFIQNSEDLIKKIVCNGKMDLVFALDGSGSVDELDYTISKNFIAEMIESFTKPSTDFGMLVYSTDVKPIFQLGNDLRVSEMATRARDALHPQRNSNIDMAIIQGIEMFNITTSLPQILVVLTDGPNSGDNLTDAVAKLAETEIIPLVIGIGPQIDRNELELIALNDTKRLFTLSDYEALRDFLFGLRSITCQTHQKAIIDETYHDTLAANEVRLYEIEMPSGGLGINLTVTTGKTTGYWSRTQRVPSSAIYDGVINSSTEIPSAAFGYQSTYIEGNPSIYIAIQGVEAINNYMLRPAALKPAPATSPPTTTSITTEMTEEESTTAEETEPTTIETTEPPTTTEEETESPTTTPTTTTEPTTTEETETTEPATDGATSPLTNAVLLTSITFHVMTQLINI